MYDYELDQVMSKEHPFPYAVEFEYRRRDNTGHPTPNLIKLLKQAGITDLRSVTNLHKDQSLPIPLWEQKPFFRNVRLPTIYNDGSVDSELVMTSMDGRDLSNAVDVLNNEVKFTERCGQHISMYLPKFDNKSIKNHWIKRHYSAVQNIAVTLERSMLLKKGSRHRGNEFCEFTKDEWSSFMGNKYRAVFIKSFYWGEKKRFFIEFRLHNPIPSAKTFFNLFPSIVEDMDDKKLNHIRTFRSGLKFKSIYNTIMNYIEDTADGRTLAKLPLHRETLETSSRTETFGSNGNSGYDDDGHSSYDCDDEYCGDC